MRNREPNQPPSLVFDADLPERHVLAPKSVVRRSPALCAVGATHSSRRLVEQSVSSDDSRECVDTPCVRLWTDTRIACQHTSLRSNADGSRIGAGKGIQRYVARVFARVRHRAHFDQRVRLHVVHWKHSRCGTEYQCRPKPTTAQLAFQPDSGDVKTNAFPFVQIRPILPRLVPVPVRVQDPFE